MTRTLGVTPSQPLPAILRSLAESLTESELSDVRIHVGTAAKRMGALAFTCGDDIHFAPGQYDPTSERGVWLLGHELAHVIQQRTGRVRNPRGYGVVVVRDEALEAEADRFAERLVERWQRGPTDGGAAIQRMERTDEPGFAPGQQVIMDPRFDKLADIIDLDNALRRGLGHHAKTATMGKDTNLRGELAEMMAQKHLESTEHGLVILPKIKLAAPDVGRLREIKDFDHVGFRDLGDSLQIVRLYETKSGRDKASTVRNELMDKRTKLIKHYPESARLYKSGVEGLPDRDAALRSVDTPSKEIELVTIGPRGRGFDRDLELTVEEMQELTDYVVARYLALEPTRT
jgi:hypothetical protein